jgi:hypothetical protein
LSDIFAKSFFIPSGTFADSQPADVSTSAMAETLIPANHYTQCTYRGQEQVPRIQVNQFLQREETNCTSSYPRIQVNSSLQGEETNCTSWGLKQLPRIQVKSILARRRDKLHPQGTSAVSQAQDPGRSILGNRRNNLYLVETRAVSHDPVESILTN